MDSKDIDISLSDGVLSIRGERETGKTKEKHDLMERSYGSFARSASKEVKHDKISVLIGMGPKDRSPKIRKRGQEKGSQDEGRIGLWKPG